MPPVLLSGAGALYILFMLASGDVDSAQKISNNDGGFPYVLDSYDFFGRSVAAIGDLDGDGVEDIAVGATGDDDGGGEAGALYVLFMNATGTVLSAKKISNSDGNMPYTLSESGNFGSSVAAIGDFDGDGTVDLAVGAYRDDDWAENAGALYILFLLPDGTVASAQKNSNFHGNLPFTLYGTQYCLYVVTGCMSYGTGNQFGVSVTAVGDLNGDGVTDLAVGAYGYDTGCNHDSANWSGNDECDVLDHGAVFILFMNADGTVNRNHTIDDADDLSPYTLASFDDFGRSVAAIGDLDGDGLIDLAVGAPGDDEGGSTTGAAYVLALNADGTVKWINKLSNAAGDLPFTLQSGGYFGSSVAAADDIDGDGMSELIVGAPGIYNDASTLGVVHVLTLECTYTPPSSRPSISPFPTVPPTPTPTPLPTPAPTKTTTLIVAPKKLRLSAEKPASVSDNTVLIVNPNDEVMNGSVSLMQRALSQHVSWSVNPPNFRLEPGGYETLTVTVDSTGLQPGDYALAAQVMAETPQSLPVNTSFHVGVEITAPAIRSTTRVNVSGTPVLGERWNGIQIEARDSDNFPITASQNEAFGATLTSIVSKDIEGNCDVQQTTGGIYEVGCTAPTSTKQAGDWNLTVALDEKAFFSTVVHARCPAGFYEDQLIGIENEDYKPSDGLCKECDRDTMICDNPGARLTTFDLWAGFWRSGDTITMDFFWHDELVSCHLSALNTRHNIGRHSRVRRVRSSGVPRADKWHGRVCKFSEKGEKMALLCLRIQRADVFYLR